VNQSFPHYAETLASELWEFDVEQSESAPDA
jgi:hypothetical protein